MCFRSPLSRMKATSRRTIYTRMSMIQWWKREKSVDDQNCLAGVFPFVFQEISDDDICQSNCVPSSPSGQLVVECDKNNISKPQHDPTIDSRDMTTRVLLVSSNSTLLSLAEFSLLSLTFFFLNWWPLCIFIGTFSSNYNFVPHLCLHVFYFVFHVNYLVYFCLNC